MICFGRRSILNKISSVLTATVVLSTLTLAQHPVAPVAPIAPVRVSPPPMYHPPVMQRPVAPPPMIHSPIYAPPIYTLPRNGIVPPTRGSGTPIVLPPVRPIHPVRPILPVVLVYSPRFFFGDPFLRFNSCWWAGCDLFWPLTFAYPTVSSPGPVNYVYQANEPPVYVYGSEREDFPQLFLKDGTILNVTDYWVVDGQLHFKVIEQPGQKPIERSMPFDELDLQTTVDANSARGFRFVLRNEPVEQYLQHHPEEPPPALPPSQRQ